MEQPKTEKLLHSIKETSAATGFCYRTIWRYVKAGRIRSVRCGGSVMIPAVELQRIVEKGF